MQISASTGAEVNPGCNIGNFLQMIQLMGANQSSAPGTGMINAADEGTDGNPFAQILLQQMVTLLQAGGVDLSDASASKEDLLSAFKKLLGGDQTSTDAEMSDLACFAQAAQQLIMNNGNQLLSAGEEKSGSIEETTTAGSAKAKDFLPAGQLTSLIVQAIQDSLKENKSKITNQPDVKTGLLQTAEAVAKTAEETPQQDTTAFETSGTAFGEEVKNLLKNKNGDIGQNEKSVLQEVDSAVTDLNTAESRQATQTTASIPETKPGQNNLKMKDIATDMPVEKPSMENAAVESVMSKTGADVKVIMPEHSAKSDVSGVVKKEDDQSNVLKVAGQEGQDAKKNAAAETDALHNDRHMENGVHESRNAGRDGNQNEAAALESQGAADKIKPELKSKTAGMEKGSENNYLNPTAVSAGAGAKQDTQEISATSVINRVAAEFRENLLSEGGRVKITLTPPSLGSLEMDVSVVNSKVKVMLIAENRDVQKMLSGNIDTLKTTLQSQGLTIERCDVMMQNNQDEYPRNFNGQFAFGQEQSGRERSSGQETFDDKPLTRPTVGTSQQGTGRRLQYSGAETISLFA